MDWEAGTPWVQTRLGTAGIGQFLSVCIATTSVCSAALAKEGVSLPATQSSANYVLLAVVYGTYVLCKRRGVRGSLWAYAALALVDVQANMLIVAAFRYTSVTSVTLLDCATIPAVMVLSYLVFRARYRLAHVGGAGLSVCGLAVLLLSDRGQTGSSGTNPVLGDLLVIAGAALYAVGNVMQESLLGDAEPTEVLAFLGGFGALWSAVAVATLERKQLVTLSVNWRAGLIASGFNLAMFAYYSCVPLMLKWHSAAFMNVSLLTSDLWAALARVAFFGGFSREAAAYFSISFALVAGGLVMYALAPDIYDSSSLKNRGSSYKLARSRATLYSTYSFSPPDRAPSHTPLGLYPSSTAAGASSGTNCQQAGCEDDVEAYHAGDHLMLTSFESATDDVPSRPEAMGAVLPDADKRTWMGSRP